MRKGNLSKIDPWGTPRWFTEHEYKKHNHLKSYYLSKYVVSWMKDMRGTKL